MQFLEPFSNGLWLLLVRGFVLMVFDLGSTERQEERSKVNGENSAQKRLYVFCTILGAESPEFEYEMISGSFLSYRIVVFGFDGCTPATLASVLIKSNAIIYHGPSTLEELKESTACILITTSTSTVLPYIGRNAPNPLTIKEQANAVE